MDVRARVHVTFARLRAEKIFSLAFAVQNAENNRLGVDVAEYILTIIEAPACSRCSLK